MKNAIMISMLFLMAGMSGCLGEEDAEPLPMTGDAIQIAEYNHTDSYQFNNYAPMGMGNETSVGFNQTNMSIYVDINMTAGFHQPLLWEQGSVNVSVLDNNETVLWSNQSSSGQSNHTIVISDNYSYNGNFTLRIMADGSDNATDGEVADWYVVRYEVWCEWRDA